MLNEKIRIMQGLFFSVPVDFQISNARLTNSHQYIYIIKTENLTGFGGGVGHPPFFNMFSLSKAMKYLKNLEISSIEDVENTTRLLFSKGINKYVIYGLEIALYDIVGKLQNIPFYSFFGKKMRSNIPVSEEIFIKSPKEMANEAKNLVENGAYGLKVKVTGTKQDIEIIKAITNAVGDVPIRIDANRGYTLKNALSILSKINDACNLELVEEPCKSLKEDALIRQTLQLPIMLDESIQGLPDLKRAISMNAIDVLNIKLHRIGGLGSARQLINICNKTNIACMTGCAEDLGVPMAAHLHVATTLKNFYPSEGIGSKRLGFDYIENEFTIVDGHVPVSDNPGLGVDVSTAKLKHYSDVYNFAVNTLDDYPLAPCTTHMKFSSFELLNKYPKIMRLASYLPTELKQFLQ